MKDIALPQPTYIYGEEEALELAQEDNVITAKGPIPFLYSNIKKAKSIVLKFREKHGLGTIITIEPNPNLRKMKNLDFTISNTICPYQGIYFGRYMGMKNDTHIWSPINITSIPKSFDLEKDDHLADWMVMRMFRHLHGSYYNAKTGDKPYFFVKDEKAEMTGGYDDAKMIVDVFDKVRNLNAEMLLMVARELGLSIVPGVEKNIGSKEISGYVMKQAITNPKMILDILAGSTSAIKSVLHSAVYSGVIFVDHRGYTYKGNLIGRTKEEAISTLQADKATFQLVSIQSKKSDLLAIRLNKELELESQDEVKPETEF